MLANHRIVFEDDRDAASEDKLREEAAGRWDNQKFEHFEQGPTKSLAQDTVGRPQSKRLEMKDKEPAPAERYQSTGGLDVVYVEASPEQVRAVLNDLGSAKSIVILGVSAAPPSLGANAENASTRKSNAPAGPDVGRAQHVPAVRDWMLKNFDNLPETFQLGKSLSTLGTAGATGGAAGAMGAAAGSVRRNERQPSYQRALFVLRSLDASKATESPAAASPAQSGPAQSGAAFEKQ